MTRLLRPLLSLALVAITGILLVMAADKPVQEQRKQAQADLEAGNFRDAGALYRRFTLDPQNRGQTLAEDLSHAVTCLQQLQQQGQIDSLFQQSLAAHPEDWRAFWRCAALLRRIEHYGFLVAGEFQRGQQRGGGAFIDVTERDRVQALIWMNQARRLLPADTEGAEKANFFRDFADCLRESDEAWKLQDLTDLTAVPDYPEPSQRGRFWPERWGRGQSQGAPVDAAGNPVFFQVPPSFEQAESDGQRWRWCLQQVEEFNVARRAEVRFEFAQFLQDQFGVQTLQQWGIRLPDDDHAGEDVNASIWSLRSLSDQETIARLATGIKRFTLPDEFNYIRIYRDIADTDQGHYGELSLGQLARIFENRQQYGKAAEQWRESIRRFPQSAQEKQAQLQQIVGNWGQFEPVSSTAAGSGAKVDYRFRNGTSVAFTAQRIKIPQLISDIQQYLQSSPQQLDWQQLQVEQIGYRLVQQNEVKYLGETVAQWSLDLKPRPEHFDRRISISTPLQQAGAYLVTAQMANGNTSRIILWLDDTAIIKKPLSGQMLYYVADAATGEPVDHARVEFFGWRQERVENSPRQFRILTQRFAEFSNADGILLTNEKLQGGNFQWMAVAKTDGGRFAYLGFSGVWFGQYHLPRYDDTKVYIVTDRPVYRPDQKVQFKFWIREASYEAKDESRFARQKFTVKIHDPQGTEVFQRELETDEFGGLAGEYALPKGAPLGSYSISLDDKHRLGGGNQFRVEEYKKPEFEVTIDAPDEPVQMGEKVAATIRAKYYFGAPVTHAKVKFKVERSAREARWYPYDPWDWLYGNGYWWYSPDRLWYPGFRIWGCLAPRPSWFHWNPDPPELVLDQEGEIGPDGTVKIEIDTALAKALHGDQDHEYTITAEVTDASRRTIVGQGSVLVSRQPFKIFAWTNRGHYRVGDPIVAEFQARTLAGKGVSGTGKLQLLKVTYADGKPQEQIVQEWELTTDEYGHAQQTLNAGAAGQYRLSLKMQTGPDALVIEGGYLFLVRGEGFDGSGFEFNDLELIADKKHYAPGDKVQLLVNTNRIGSTVLLFVRPTNGIASGAPRVLRLTGKSTIVELDVTQSDMPNFFVEALTVSGGQLHDRIQEFMVPPEKRVLNIDVVTSSARYLPGQKADVELKVTDAQGEPYLGSLVLSVYDRAVEYISGGSNVGDIKEFFWKWRRSHHPQSESNLQKWFSQLLKQGEVEMRDLGIFGGMTADQDNVVEKEERRQLRKGAGREMMLRDAAPMAAAAPIVAEEQMAKGVAGFGGAGGGEPLVIPTIRNSFADTAFWKADITTDKSGLAKVSFDMPENISSWKLRAWGMGQGTRVGEATAEVVTAKNLIVRLQAPRFFTETDEVVLSAVVHNYLQTEKKVQVELQLGGESLSVMDDDRETSAPRYSAMTTVTIPANGETRVDWRVKAVKPGIATVTMKALTDEESDAMQQSFPVQVHGILKTESFSGVIRPDAQSGVVKFTVPEDRQPEQSRLEVRYSPTLAGAMVDALPYLADYPYGCTEQTLNRFIPTVITQRILLKMGLDLKAIQQKRTNLNAQEIGDAGQRAQQWKRFDRNPVFDEEEVAQMVKIGVRDLTAMQNSDGGWGWFSGFGEHSYPHTTAVVVHGLQLAARNDIALPEGVLENGVAWLKKSQAEQVQLLQEGERHEKDPQRKERYKTQCSDIDAMVFSVLVDAKATDAEMQRFLYRDRNKVSLYAQALLGLALHELGSIEQRDMVVRNIDQFIKVDAENQTAYLDLPNDNSWWYWYGNQVEANAHYLKLLTKVNVKDPKAAGLVKYLINNRKQGTYWNSTRDTAYCIESLADYLAASGEAQPNMAVEIWFDGELKQTVEITPQVLFTFDNGFVVEGAALTSGVHTLELRRKSLSPDKAPLPSLYYNAYVTNFTTEEFITAAGLEVRVGRKYYKLVQDKEATTAVPGARGQVIDQSVIKYNRVPLKSLDEVRSGDLLEIELEIDSKNDYEYLVFEDLKAAGCEPVDVRSGYTPGGLGAYVEFRDEKVAFFLRQLARGKHSVSYRVRAEIPGKFSALPTKAHAMYAPELRGNSDEMKLRISDAK